MDKKIYLDYASSSPLLCDFLDEYFYLLKHSFANPNSKHHFGVESKTKLEKNRKNILRMLPFDNLILTSGATESNNQIIRSIAKKNIKKGKHIITSKMEHPSVLNTIKQLEKEENYEVSYIETYIDGKIRKEQVASMLRSDTILVSLMSVNNEVGALSEIEQIALFLKEKKAIFHVDATQSIGKIDFDFSNVDIISFSAHKIHGPKGVGFIAKKNNVKLVSILKGGNQEEKLRPGTQNFPTYLIGLKVVTKMLEKQKTNLEKGKKINNLLKKELLKIKEVEIISLNNASPFITSFYIEGKKAEVVLNALSYENIFVSTKSACSNKDTTSSPSVFALCKDKKKSNNVLRVSLSFTTKEEEVFIFIEKLSKIIKELI